MPKVVVRAGKLHYNGKTADEWLVILGRGGSAMTARDALKAIGPKEVIPLAIKALDSDDGAMQSGAAQALGLFGADAKDAIPALAAHLNMRPGTAEQVSKSLAEIGKGLGKPPPEVVALLASDGRQTKVLAAASVWRIDSGHAEALAVLREFLQAACQVQNGPERSPDALLYAATLRAVGDMGAAAQSLLPELSAIISMPRSVECMVNHSGLRSWTLSALTQMGSASKSVLPAVLDSSVDLNFDGANLVPFLRDVTPDAVPQVLEAIQRTPAADRHTLIACLWFMGQPGKMALRSLLDDPDAATREQTFKTMSVRFKTSDAVCSARGKGRLNVLDHDDGHFEIAEQFGRPVIRSLGTYVYFSIDDPIAFDIAAECRDSFTVQFLLLNRTPITFDVQYDGDSQSSQDAQMPWGTTSLVQTTGSGGSQNFVLNLPHARLANRLPGNADFRIHLREGSALELENAAFVRFFAE